MSNKTEISMTNQELQAYLIKNANEINDLCVEAHAITDAVKENGNLTFLSDWAREIVKGENTFGSNPDSQRKQEELKVLARHLSYAIARSIEKYIAWARDGKIVNPDLDHNPMLNELGGAKEVFIDLLRRINTLVRKGYYAYFTYLSDSEAKKMAITKGLFYDSIESTCLNMPYDSDIRSAKGYKEKPEKNLQELIAEEGSNDDIIRKHGLSMISTYGENGIEEVSYGFDFYENHDAVLRDITALSPKRQYKNKFLIEAAYRFAFSLEKKFKNMKPEEFRKYTIGNMKLTPEEKEAFDTDIRSYMEQIGTHK